MPRRRDKGPGFAAPAGRAALKFTAELFVVTIAALCFSIHAWAIPEAGQETIAPAVKPAVRKPATRSEPPDRAPPTRSGSCAIGVVVATGDEFTVTSRGWTVFQHKVTAVPIPGWGLSDLMFTRVRAAIPAGMSVLRIPYNPAKIPSRDASKDTLMDRLFRDQKADLAEHMRQIVKGTNCQFYIQIGNSISRLGSQNYTVRGFGIVNNLVFENRVYLYALAFIRVLDGRDFSVIRQGSALINLQPLMVQRLQGAKISGPYRELPEVSFPTRPEDAAADPALRDGVRAMLTESLDKTLPLLLGRRPASQKGDAKEH